MSNGTVRVLRAARNGGLVVVILILPVLAFAVPGLNDSVALAAAAVAAAALTLGSNEVLRRHGWPGSNGTG